MCNIEQIGFAPNGDPVYSNERDHQGKLKLLTDLPEALTVWKEFASKGKVFRQDEHYFVANAPTKELVQRLDTLFYHPAKQNAQNLLSKAKYPLHRIGELVTMLNRVVVPQFEYADEMVRYIGLANIQPYEGTYFVSDVLGEKIKSAVKYFEPESVIFAKLRPELRKVVFIPSEEEPGFASSECFIFKANSRILPQYLALMLRSDLVYGQIIFQVTGLGRPRIGKTELLSAKIPLPSLEKQRELVNAMNASESRKLMLLEKSEFLRQQAEELARHGFAEIEQELCR
jgi:type I restriction enzyme M protein